MHTALGQPDVHASELPVVYVTLKLNETIVPEELLAAHELVPERVAVPVRSRSLKKCRR